MLGFKREIGYSSEESETFKLAAKFSLHPAYPVLAGIIKTMEVESGLALLMNAGIKF
ncbi:MAG: hypothetical protein JRJ44_01345 [Deltaproteobacteria bacterium]|nr:hypothetical protein [Deltaproteobacteria bacterium]